MGPWVVGEEKRREGRPGLPPRQVVRYLGTVHAFPRPTISLFLPLTRPEPYMPSPFLPRGRSDRLRRQCHAPLLLVMVAILTALLALAACESEGEEQPEAVLPPTTTLPAEPLPETDPEAPLEGHHRHLVFVSRDADSTTVVPWVFQGLRAGTSETRGRGVWIGRGGTWERLVNEAEEAGAVGEAWQIVPGPGIGLVVSAEGRLESLRLRSAPPALRTRLGIVLADWSTAPREGVRFHRAVTEVEGEGVEGFLVDYAGITGPGQQPRGDWLFLQGGDVFQAFFVAVTPATAETPVLPTWMGWTRIAVRERRWSALEMEWDEMRAFEDARRDIPTRWELRSPEGELEVVVESVGSHLEALEGEGALLPVEAFFTVRGEASFDGETVAVHGVLRHRQP